MDRKYKTIVITSKEAESLLSTDVAVESLKKWYDLPEDAYIDDIRIDKFRGIIEALLWSDSFQLVPFGQYPPIMKRK